MEQCILVAVQNFLDESAMHYRKNPAKPKRLRFCIDMVTVKLLLSPFVFSANALTQFMENAGAQSLVC